MLMIIDFNNLNLREANQKRAAARNIPSARAIVITIYRSSYPKRSPISARAPRLLVSDIEALRLYVPFPLI
jgi:hypothetical protein